MSSGSSNSSPGAPPNEGASRREQQERAAVEAVVKALRTIEFGSVLIKIHQSQVVGIETATKVRLEA